MTAVIYFELKNNGIYERRCKTMKGAQRELKRLKSVHGSDIVNYEICLED